jgi:copper chaperone
MLRQGLETGMLESEKRTQLPLTSSSAECSCCTPENFSPSAVTAVAEFILEGLTCGHCAQTVERAVSALEGVDSAAIELVPGGRSRLLVGGKADGAAVRQAVIAAGYMVIGK